MTVVYEIRPLTCDDQVAALHLVEERVRWSMRHRQPCNTRDLSAAIHAGTGMVGFCAEGVLDGLLHLDHGPLPGHWPDAHRAVPSLRIVSACTRVGQAPVSGALMTRWARDFAARAGLEQLCHEIPVDTCGAHTRLVTHLTTLCGWEFAAAAGTGHRYTLLVCTARADPTLAHQVHCRVPVPAPARPRGALT
ncbi:hypothetical protein ACIG3E_33175 [Streptomyces sp. NPDC053474]|uniref:hypothetical protein n=1 Tax=Streptomyces sp. NPDC053474 TaxID=3365704 RepID=UPI0037D05140